MRHFFISLLLIFSSVYSWAQTIVTWNNPVMMENRKLKFTKVEFADTATVVSMHINLPSKVKFGFPSSTKLIADGKEYAVKACSYVPIDSGVPMPESGELDLLSALLLCLLQQRVFLSPFKGMCFLLMFTTELFRVKVSRIAIGVMTRLAIGYLA